MDKEYQKQIKFLQIVTKSDEVTLNYPMGAPVQLNYNGVDIPLELMMGLSVDQARQYINECVNKNYQYWITHHANELKKYKEKLNEHKLL